MPKSDGNLVWPYSSQRFLHQILHGSISGVPQTNSGPVRLGHLLPVRALGKRYPSSGSGGVVVLMFLEG